MAKRYQIQEYINNNVYKEVNEEGKVVWHCVDLRYNDTFHCETYNEAANTFVALWDLLTDVEQDRAS